MMTSTRQQRATTRRSRRRLARATQPALSAPAAEQLRERNAGGPQDRASYHCECGYVFEASVSTSVGCPHCGSAQAW